MIYWFNPTIYVFLRDHYATKNTTTRMESVSLAKMEPTWQKQNYNIVAMFMMMMLVKMQLY